MLIARFAHSTSDRKRPNEHEHKLTRDSSDDATAAGKFDGKFGLNVSELAHLASFPASTYRRHTASKHHVDDDWPRRPAQRLGQRQYAKRSPSLIVSSSAKQ